MKHLKEKLRNAGKLFSVFLFVISCIFFAACRREPDIQPADFSYDLLVYTVLEENVSLPVVKEFEERTGLKVKVETGTTQALLKELKIDGPEGSYDVVFGVGADTLEAAGEYWQPYESVESMFLAGDFCRNDSRWTPFSVSPLVILYNTNVVTYREVPEGFKSLAEPKWKGRVAFVNPVLSGLYASALTETVYACREEEDYMERLAENLEPGSLSGLSEVNSGILDGRYSLGVTTEGAAYALRVKGADVDYIYPKEGTAVVLDGTAVVKGCAHREAAGQFLDFTVSKDTQRILVSDLNRRPVRNDVQLPPGLPSMRSLAPTDLKESELFREKDEVLKHWNALFPGKRGDGG